MNTFERPAPQEFLALLKEEEAQRGRGRLKIFFGFSAGVGKTYAMLNAAAKLKESQDVVIGFVETHGRKETAELLGDLEILPRRRIEYRGTWQEEFDIDLALKRKPSLILVDELAHTNVQGSRHAKRWQDIQELIEAGIDVYTTLNVQHVESLHDLVARITGVLVQERVPDSVIENALEIELIDLPPDELIQRLKEGKVYVAAQALSALDNFFRKGNLIALRELALRYTAQHVDMQMMRYRKSHMITAAYPVAERLLVCVSASPLSVRLVRAGKRMADALKARWTVAYVQPSQSFQSLKKSTETGGEEQGRSRLFATLSLAESLGADTVELSGDVARSLTDFARYNNFTKIIIGKSSRPRWQEILNGSVIDEVVRLSGPVDVYVISGDNGEDIEPKPFFASKRSRPGNYFYAVLVVTFTSFVAACLRDYFELSNLVMAYILAVVIVAVNFGRGPSILASVLSVACFDFFFVPPFLTFAVSDTQYLVTFAVMLVIALVISTLTSRVRMQADWALQKERRTAALYELSRSLSSTINFEDLVKAGLKHIGELFYSQVALVVYDESGTASVIAGQGKGLQIDGGVAVWAYRNKQPAGLGTSTLPGARARYLPLTGFARVVGVLAVEPANSKSFNEPEQLHLLETFAAQMAIACERALLSRENEQNRVIVKSEQLRNSLLSSVSHDLRTPLATISGAASGIVEGSENITVEDCRKLAGEIFEQSVRLNKLVGNLLDMTRLQDGSIVLHKQLFPVEEVIGSALSAYSRELDGFEIETSIEPSLLESCFMVSVDGSLIQQVMINLLENALKYGPDGGLIKVSVFSQPGQVVFAVDDQGPGVPNEIRKNIFDKFYRGQNPACEGSGKKVAPGAGLGLSICAAIVDAHGGQIWVEDSALGGASFRFSLPVFQSDLNLNS
jgi:two-component system sensor histidine kinase KdpD